MSWADLPQYLRVLAALAFIIALMGGISLLIKRLGIAGTQPVNPGKKRLKMLESLPLDARRRMVILGCDDKEYIVILGPNGETLLGEKAAKKENAKPEDE